MFKSIISTSPYINIGGVSCGSIYVAPIGSNPATGMVRYNGQDMEVYDGIMWQRLPHDHVTINMNQDATDAIMWAQKKMCEEAHINDLAAKNVTVADALARYELAADNLKMVLILTDETK